LISHSWTSWRRRGFLRNWGAERTCPGSDEYKNLPFPSFLKRGNYNGIAELGLARDRFPPLAKGGRRGIFLYGTKNFFGYGIELEQDLPIVEAQYS